jgi:predicted  nucleic acid-binding Zn-ribbon protein
MTNENDNTADLTMDEKLDKILSELSGMKERIGALETTADDRKKETRPLLERAIQEMVLTHETIMARLGGIETELRLLNRKFDVLNKEMLNVKTSIEDHEVRLGDVERRPS